MTTKRRLRNPRPGPQTETAMPAEMMNYWEWAASKGISYRTTSTEKEYYEYLAAAGEPVEPYVPPPPTPPTVTIVNRWQQMRVAGMRPAPAYSRVIVAHAAAAGGGVWGFGYSPSFGRDTRLLQVKACVQIEPAGPVERSAFSIHQGSVAPNRRQDIEGWDRVIDFGTYAGFHGLTVWGQFRQFTWDLTKLYSGQANRFGVLFFNSSTNTGVVQVFFKMSEG